MCTYHKGGGIIKADGARPVARLGCPGTGLRQLTMSHVRHFLRHSLRKQLAPCLVEKGKLWVVLHRKGNEEISVKKIAMRPAASPLTATYLGSTDEALSDGLHGYFGRDRRKGWETGRCGGRDGSGGGRWRTCGGRDRSGTDRWRARDDGGIRRESCRGRSRASSRCRCWGR